MDVLLLVICFFTVMFIFPIIFLIMVFKLFRMQDKIDRYERIMQDKGVIW